MILYKNKIIVILIKKSYQKWIKIILRTFHVGSLPAAFRFIKIPDDRNQITRRL